MTQYARYTVRLSSNDGERVERVRKQLSIDDATFSENKLVTVLIRRGLDSIERELDAHNDEQPRKAA